MSAAWPGGAGPRLRHTALAAEAFILVAAAQAGFLGGPRVLANMALDKWFPTRFACSAIAWCPRTRFSSWGWPLSRP